jgi:hypothetical protein
MNIVVWENATTNDDGTVVKQWTAATVGPHHVTGTGENPVHALRLLVRWLKLGLDPSNNAVPPLDTMTRPPSPPPEGASVVSREELGLPPPPPFVPEPIYPPSPPHIQGLFDAGVPMADATIPEGWVVRLVEPLAPSPDS